jgi:FkbH-like protein
MLSTVDASPASYLRAARALESGEGAALGLPPVRVSSLSTFTYAVLTPYLVVEAARRGLAVRHSVGPYGQLEQQLLDPESPIYESEPDFIVLAARIEEGAPALVHDFVRLSREDVEREIDQYVSRIERLLRAIRTHTRARVLVWNQVSPSSLAAGLADAGLDPSQTDAIAHVNRRLARACARTPGAFVFDAARVANEIGLAAWHDPKLFHLGRIPLAAPAQRATARQMARYLAALTTTPRKCLVLDLDNTLWGGVLGEDGFGGIALGDDYPGNVFKTFQRRVRSLRDRGVLLAIASKNDEGAVAELFERHPHLVLRWSDFAARQIHWKDKASSVAAIAEELNISTDALAFFDDSPQEREWVRARIPAVQVIEVPTDALRYGEALEASGAFDHLVLTEEDRSRAEMYRSDQERRHLAETVTSVDDFLRSLGMRVTVGAVDGTTLPRVAQLVAKTNQFNLTTRRHTQADIESMVAGGAISLWMQVADRFGDNGIVGSALASDGPRGAVSIDTFLMSCRVMGRKVELGLLRALVGRAIARGATRLLAEYIPTGKNGPAARFLPESGFTPIPDRPGWWQLDLSHGAPRLDCPFEVIERS